MKYMCEICGCIFEGKENCIAHEEECKAKNERAIYIRDTFNDLLLAAESNKLGFGCEVATDSGKVWCTFERASFIVNRNRIDVVVRKPVEASDEGKTKGTGKKVK